MTWPSWEERYPVTPSAPLSNSSPPDRLPGAAPPSLAAWLWRDGELRSACLIAGLLIGYQLVVTLLQPPWIGPVTDWLRAALAWPTLVEGGQAHRDRLVHDRCGGTNRG